jgi:hypothetical protein
MDMHEQLIDVLANDRRAKMQREAEIYRMLVDNSSLRFGPSNATRARRALARFFVRVAERLEPSRPMLEGR